MEEGNKRQEERERKIMILTKWRNDGQEKTKARKTNRKREKRNFEV